MLTDENNIYGVECALGFQGYSHFRSENFPICIYDGNRYFQGTPTFIGVEEVGMPTEDEIVTVNGRRMTNPYRSVIDLIKTNPYSEDVVIAMSYMIESEEDMARMWDMAEKYYVSNEVEELINLAKELEY